MILLTAVSLLTGIPAYLATRRFVLRVASPRSFFSHQMNICSRDGNTAPAELPSKGRKS